MNHEREQSFRCIMICMVEREDPYQFANRLKPHLTHVKDDALTRFYRFLTTQPSSAIFAVEDLIMNCYSNKRLFYLIQQLVDTML
jgi:hypothetical protein